MQTPMPIGGDSLKIVIYRLTGRQGPFTIPDWVCHECDLTVTSVLKACRAAAIPEDTVTIRPWLTHIGEAWRAGARQAPAVLVNGELYSQKIVPDADKLATHLQRLLAAETGPSEGPDHES